MYQSKYTSSQLRAVAKLLSPLPSPYLLTHATESSIGIVSVSMWPWLLDLWIHPYVHCVDYNLSVE